MKNYYLDWSRPRGLDVLTDDSDEVTKYPTFDALLDSIEEPSRIIGECTFESYEPTRRDAVIARMEIEGHEFRVFSPRQTPRVRSKMSLEKSDYNDALAIREIGRTGLALKDPTSVAPIERQEKAKAANLELRNLRRSYRQVDSSRSKAGFKMVSEKDIYAQKIISLLPKFGSLTTEQQVAFKGTGGYSKVLIAAVAMATKHSETRKDFDHITGLYSNAYPSQIRSDVHHWRWRFAMKTEQITLTDFRREVRWLYHRLDKLREHL